MKIMLMFLILSLILIIGTAIYIRNKENSINHNIKQDTARVKEVKRKYNKKKLNDLFKIEIKNNMICLNNRYSNIIKLGNIDYNMLSIHEQDAIETVLIQTALGIDYPIQFFSTTEYIDTSKVVSLIKQNKNINSKIQDYKNYLTEYLENLMENKSISVVKNYAIISYDGTYEGAVEELNRRSMSFKGNLLRAKIVCEILNEDEIKNLIYRELNKNSLQNISKLQKGGNNIYVDKK